MARPTIAVYSDGQFSTRTEESLWDRVGYSNAWVLPAATPGITVLSVEAGIEKHGYIVECRGAGEGPGVRPDVPYSRVWCPRIGDLYGYLMGPALAFSTAVQRHSALAGVENHLAGLVRSTSDIANTTYAR